jgi:hypothetical protein
VELKRKKGLAKQRKGRLSLEIGVSNLPGDYFLRDGWRDMGICAACNDIVARGGVRVEGEGL